MSRHARKLPAVRCEIVESFGGPHPGCEEFAPATDVRCASPATHLVKYVDYYGEPVKDKVCTFHASPNSIDLDHEPGKVAVYRFRSL